MADQYQSEAQLEDHLIKKLQTQGYQYIAIPDETALLNHFRDILNQRNQARLKGRNLSDREFKAVFNELIGSKTHYQVAQLLRGSDTQPYGKIVIQRDDNTNLYLEFFDGVKPENNIFEVTHQMTITSGKHENRYDVLILLNGLPVTQIELKRKGKDFTEAFHQIIRYRDESVPFAKLLRTIQLYVISNGNETRYFANGDGPLNSSFLFYWTDVNNNWLNDLDAFSASFFEQSRFHSLIANYSIFDSVNKRMLIMRPYQIFATEAILKQAKDHPGENAYVWHTTGSGKTITAFKTSQLLAQKTAVEKVIFLIDRADLDVQTAKNFNAYLPETTSGEPALDMTTSTYNLVQQLKRQDNHLIVTTIQKLNQAVKSDRYKADLTAYHDKPIAFIEDEAHRSQFGEMRRNVNRWFQNAQHFGFTGTPIFTENKGAKDRTTADLYGKCLHKYLIKDAIRDHNVLGFAVQYMNTIKKGDERGTDRLVKGIDTQAAFESEDRLHRIVDHILEKHEQISKQRHYNAIFTVPSTRIALKYYELFKVLMGDRNINVTTIYTWVANEEDNEAYQDKNKGDQTSRHGLDTVIEDYNAKYHTSFSTDHFQDYFGDVSKRMKAHNDQTPEDNIDILIVVNMFLTGFDSPRLSTLYVDKNLEWHGLIQAYSRTNRVEKKEKPFGNIVVYRNLKQATDQAVALFSDDDPAVIFAPTYAALKGKLDGAIASLQETAPDLASIDQLYSQGDKALEKFVLDFRDVLRLYNQIRVYDEFQWDDFAPAFNAQKMEDYRGKYYEAYRRIKKNPGDKDSILENIDFEIELLQTDKIDVTYILNLINTIDLSTPTGREEDTNKIKRLLHNADNDDLKSKAALLERFLDQIIPKLQPRADVSAELNNFLDYSQKLAMADFAKKHDIPVEFVAEQLTDFNFYGHLNGHEIMSQLGKSGLKFGERRKVKQQLDTFITEAVQAYTLTN
ncbi:hsdR protein [Agrilactobacillus composti DSM 18527 = JCM 14202]|uniref:Type I restriction enzyme endonuclease subunit n=1 Tax=Agrilactobacillus composti DSM 18527 = JCM 14202 TaxID=1423734 RepID=A0A0R1XKK5_9LACO|nr:type I restriction endonuclease subunit R [Agrilactobacillus composti]KRM30690.1 hsdR protein [Agrilactobacillus composti DSM 18527 = JCM 14202]